MNTPSRFLMLIAAACTLLALAACGNKGNLMLPQKAKPAKPQVVKPADASPADSTGNSPLPDVTGKPAAGNDGHA